MVAIHETLRPASIDEMVGHHRQRKQLALMKRTTGWKGLAFWLVGPSGTGKTTLARIIGASVAAEETTYEIDAIDLTLDTLRDWERKGANRPLWGDGYAFIINEAHNLSSKCVSRLQTVLESEAMRHSTWIFTTTDAGQMRLFDGKFDSFPFMSRCTQLYLELTPETKEEFAKYLRNVAVEMELGPDDSELYCRMIEDFDGNLRMCMNQLGAGVLCV